jgi:uncharacterized membrane protein
MPDSPAEIVHHVVEEVKELEHEAEVGQSPRTPFIVLSGVTVFVAVIVAVLLVIAFTAYYLSK